MSIEDYLALSAENAPAPPPVKIAIYAICRNEAENIGPFLETCAGADHVLVCDTGSTDGTMALLLDAWVHRAVEFHRIEIDPWRFDTARSAALALVPEWVDVCLALDLDERLSPRWAEAVRERWWPGVNGIVTFYQNADGYDGWDDRRIHSRHGWTWRHPCHECIYPTDGVEPHRAWVPEIVVRHLRAELHTETYLPLLELGLLEEPNSTRMMYYLGREYYNAGRHEEAVHLLERYIENTKPPRREPAEVWLSKSLEALRKAS